MRQAEETLSSWDELLYIDLIYNCESKETDAIETGLYSYCSNIRTGNSYLLLLLSSQLHPKPLILEVMAIEWWEQRSAIPTVRTDANKMSALEGFVIEYGSSASPQHLILSQFRSLGLR
jgi:hypothetical protein